MKPKDRQSQRIRCLANDLTACLNGRGVTSRLRKVDDKMPKMPKPKEGDPNLKENPMNPKEIVVKEVQAVKARPETC